VLPQLFAPLFQWNTPSGESLQMNPAARPSMAEIVGPTQGYAPQPAGTRANGFRPRRSRHVSFFSSADPRGYADYLRTFSVTRGWLGAPVQVSPEFGDTSVWPGDTFGISTLSLGHVVLSWGSATPSSGKKSDIFSANVAVSTH
jgi:hypothetical protein